jgi:hypothetical protein
MKIVVQQLKKNVMHGTKECNFKRDLYLNIGVQYNMHS